jgi:hypothetical protein
MKYKALTGQEEQRSQKTPSAAIVLSLEIAEVEKRKQDQLEHSMQMKQNQLAVKRLIDQH